jgi:hypothetical protein
MRKTWTILAGVALIVGVAGPAWSDARHHPATRGTATRAMADHDRDGGHNGGVRHGDDRSGGRERHEREGFHHGGRGRDYDGYYDGYYHCGYYGCGYPYYGPYYGGYGCNYDYPCGPPYYDSEQDSQCFSHTHSGRAVRNPDCQYDRSCDCWYPSSQPPPRKGPDQSSGGPSGNGPSSPGTSNGNAGGTTGGGTSGGGTGGGGMGGSGGGGGY